MASLSSLVAGVGCILSVLVFLAPVGTFWRILKHRSTQEFESLPYVCALLSSALWTCYGIIKPGEMVVATVNGFGAAVEAVYVALFLIFSPAKKRVKIIALVSLLDVGFLAAAILVIQLTLKGETRINALGFVCSGLNILMYASPLAAMKTVVTTKSVEFMPFFLSLFICLSGGMWTIYALLVRDYFIAVPNATGFMFGIVQVALYAIYKNTERSSKSSIEDGLQQEHLITPLIN